MLIVVYANKSLMFSVIRLSAIILSVIMLSVVAPLFTTGACIIKLFTPVNNSGTIIALPVNVGLM
jgi:hypothetical protein